MEKKFRYLGAAAVAAAILVPAMALASHGKAGLWQISITMDMPGMAMPAMPDISSMPPEAQARMKAMELQMSGHGMSIQHCMTAQEVAMDKPDMSQMSSHNKDCSMENMKVAGHSFSGDMVCKGDFQGSGHMQFTYDSDEHYTGQIDIKGTSHDHPMNMKETFDGKWVSADCGTVTH